MRMILITLLLTITSAAKAQTRNCSLHTIPGQWSRSAVDISPPAPSGRQDLRICSPDRQKVVRVRDESWWVEIDGTRLTPDSKASRLAPYAELSWAPDSLAFYISESEGFSTGYHTDIYVIRRQYIRRVSGASPIVSSAFERHHGCHYRYEGTDVGNKPNVAGLQWSDAHHLVIVAEIPPVSICKQMEYFGTYLLSLDEMMIEKSFSPKQSYENWHWAFGTRLCGDFEQLSGDERKTAP
jgi:hypothetical protein